MQTLAQIKAMLEERGLAPKRSLGQNFLIDHNLVTKLVDASGVGEGDVVLEVGPGTGVLTEMLLERGCAVVASELDDGLCDMLIHRRDSGKIQRGDRLTVVRGDCLESKRELAPTLVCALERAMGRAGREGFGLVANLPYGCATPLMSTLLVDHPGCGVMAVTVQKEVVDRLSARVGTKEYGPLGVLAQALGSVEKVAVLPRECFWPRPGVTSAMAVFRRGRAPAADRADNGEGGVDARALSQTVARVFAQRRKQLGSVLKDAPVGWGEAAERAGIDMKRRAEQLGVEQLVAMSARAQQAGLIGTGSTQETRDRDERI